ncbi:MAG: hypothetical protein DHS20C02_05690 [Micavibrio sp.]|nr:MAG: hypothetical protein DHS20C02_05690 [Micavibrio sp.]
MKILITGCGSIGRRHAENAADLADETAVFDLDTDLAKSVADKTGAQLFSSLDEALSWGADGVVIATPHKTHIDLAQQAAESGADVLIEKPLSHDLDGVDDFLAGAEKAGRQVFVVCNMRFHPAVSTLRQNIERVGDVMYARAQYGNYLPNMRPDSDYKKLYCAHKDQGGGVILDAIHEIDYLSWFFGDVSSVLCEAAKRSDLKIDVEDYAALVLKHENGVRSEVHLDYLQQFKRRGCEIVGSNGTLIWQSEGKAPEHCTVRIYTAASGQWETLFEDNDLDASTMYKDLMSAFIANLKTRGSSVDLLTGRDAMKSLDIVLQARS